MFDQCVCWFIVLLNKFQYLPLFPAPVSCVLFSVISFSSLRLCCSKLFGTSINGGWFNLFTWFNVI